MASWVVEGQNSDFTSTVAEIVLGLFNNASNWTETTVGFSNIRYTTGWWDGYGNYGVIVRPLSISKNGADVLGSTSYEFEEYLQVHIFVTSATINQIPTFVWAIKSQIEKICAQLRTTAGQGIRYIGLPQWTYGAMEGDSQALQDTWHEYGRMQVVYRKVTTI